MLENTEGTIIKWTIQRNWQHWVNKTQNEDKQNKKHNTERKQTQIRRTLQQTRRTNVFLLFISVC